MNVKKSVGVGLFIFLSFLLTSAEYMTWWLNALVPNFSATAADLLSEGVGYGFQVLGLLLMALLIKKGSPLLAKNQTFWIIVLLDFLVSILACIFASPVFILFFGYLMNFMHGIILGYYLMYLAKLVDTRMAGITFGLSYGLASLAFYLISQITNALNIGTAVFVIYFAIALLTLWSFEIVSRYDCEDFALENDISIDGKLIGLVLGLILVVSAARGIGFYFPTSDTLLSGVDPVFTRCFYAIGLILAGIINDVSRRYGSVLCLLSLVFPFIVLVLRNEPNTETLFWIIGYIFFGFLAVYRITVTQDLARNSNEFFWLSVMGLAIGRVGDILGTCIGVLCSGKTVVLLVTSLAFFLISLLLFFAFYNRYYVPVRVIETNAFAKGENAEEDTTSLLSRLTTELELSEREAEVLYLLLQKKTNGEIAYLLHISENTVKFHVRNVLKKAACENRKQLLAKYN